MVERRNSEFQHSTGGNRLQNKSIDIHFEDKREVKDAVGEVEVSDA